MMNKIIHEENPNYILVAFDMGKTMMNYDGVDIAIYDKERLLVELIRNKR